MNMSQIQAMLERLSDEQLSQEMNQPSGLAPLYLVMAELQRRQATRASAPVEAPNASVLRDMQDAQAQAQQAQMQMPPEMPPMQQAPGMPAFATGGRVPGAQPNPYGFFTPEQLGAARQAEEARVKLLLGLGERPDLDASMAEGSKYIPDRSVMYDPMIAEMKADSTAARKDGINRALMQMGLGMMTAKGGSFLGAVGQGGTAGLQALDEADARRAALKKEMFAAQIAKAGAQSSRDGQLLGYAQGERSDWRAGMGTAMGAGSAAAGQAADLTNTLANSRQQAAEAAANRAASMAAARLSAGAAYGARADAKSEAEREFYLKYGFTPSSTPAGGRDGMLARQWTIAYRDLLTDDKFATSALAPYKSVGGGFRTPDGEAITPVMAQNIIKEAARANADARVPAWAEISRKRMGAQTTTPPPGTKRPPLSSFSYQD